MQLLISQGQQSTISDSKISRLIDQIILFCLRWKRDEELQNGEEYVASVRKGEEPQIYYGRGSVSYRPGETLEKKLRLSDFRELQKGGRLKIEKLERLIRRELQWCHCKRVKCNGKEMLLLEWDDGVTMSIEGEDNNTEILGRESMSISHCVLYLLTQKPDLIGSRVCSGAFKHDILLIFKERKIMVLEGDGATYILGENGWKYLDVDKKEEVQNSDEVVERILHNVGYEKWVHNLKKVIDRE